MAEQITKINLNLSQINAQTVTNLYLYGTTETPANKQRVTQNVIQVNVDSAKYMAEGAGRYAKASEVQFVEDFFAGKTTFNGKQLQNGTYTKSQLISQFGLNHDQAVSLFNFKQYQYATDPNNSDYTDRVYIWNTTEYTVSQDTEFVVNGNQRYIKNLKVLSFNDNFDFIGGNTVTNLGNYYLKTNIDPASIGKTVKFVFNNKENVKTQSIYGLSDFNFDKNFIDNTPTGNIWNALLPMKDIVNQLTSTNTFANNNLSLSHNLSGVDLSVSFKSLNHAFNSFSSLTGFENTSKIGGFSLSSSNTIKSFATTNASVKNLSLIIGNSSNHLSPLTFDLDGDGIESNHIYSQNVYFDIDADGFSEKVGWISADDGQLAFDANKNGIIDNITELFGDDKEPAFNKLRRFDTNNNGIIDAGDAQFNQLLVWRDHSQDGKTNAGELKTLSETGIREIGLNEVKEMTYQHENYISGRAKYTLTNGIQRDIAANSVIANERSEVWQSPLKTFIINDLKDLNEIATSCLSTPRNDNAPKFSLQNVA